MKQFMDANWRPDRPMCDQPVVYIHNNFAIEVFLGRYLCGEWFEYETQKGGVAGYKTLPFGFCRIVVLNHLDIPVPQWLHVVLSTFPNASAMYPAPVGKYAEDTWEHATTGRLLRQ